MLTPTCYPTQADGQTVRQLTPLVTVLAESLRQLPFEPETAKAVGAQLASSGFGSKTLLQDTMRLIRAHAGELFSGVTPVRVDEVLGELAAGYTEGLCEHAQRQQEALHSAVLDARRSAEAAVRVSEERFRTIFTEAAAGIAVVAVDGQVIEVNPAVRQMLGFDQQYPHPFTDLMHPEDIPQVVPQFHAMIEGRGGPLGDEVRFVRPDGTVFWTILSASLVRDEHGAPDYVIAIMEDVTERHQLSTRLHHQTYHDQLTLLPNRSLMVAQLDWAFSSRSPVQRVGLCHLDLDGFRTLNDTLGYQMGDQLLLAVASRLQLLSEGHLVTRAGADEFTILVPDPESTDDLIALAEQVLTGLAAPFELGQRRLNIGASMGLACHAVTDTTPEELQRHADAARSWAKQAGGGRWAVFDPHRDHAASLRFALATSIPAAVERSEFRLLYQPLTRMDTGELIGAEALVRWRHPEHGLIAPSEFIELSEQNGSIVPLGRWILIEACRQARSWVDQLGPAAPYVSVNVAPRQLAEPGWLDEVSGALEQTGLAPGQLQLEITERAVLVDEDGASQTLRTLRDMGVRLAIDDFGTGYSSLSYLRRLPVHGLKIDGEFIRGLRESNSPGAKDYTIIAALISMAHALDLVVTAEWVETASQAHRLAALGCDVGQGHWYGAPMDSFMIMKQQCGSRHLPAIQRPCSSTLAVQPEQATATPTGSERWRQIRPTP